MSATNWGPLDPLSAAKRASARDSWNRRRTSIANIRGLKAVALYFLAACERGSQAEIARVLGVHRSTVCRAIKLWREGERKGYFHREMEEFQRLTRRLDKRQSRGMPW